MATEKRNLIDRDDLIDSLGVSDMEIFAKEVIGDAPTVDAVEVVHGCTIPAEQPKKVLLNRKCGVCDSLMLSTDAYCPGCGAKMDGDGNG